MSFSAPAGPVLETERLRLRPFAPEDFRFWVGFYASDRSRFVGGPMDESAAWFKCATILGHWGMRGFGYFSVETREGEYVGRVGPEQAEGWPEPELGWSLVETGGGRGFATEAAAAVRDWTWATLRPTGIVSFVRPENDPSRRVAERLGATHDPDTVAGWPDHGVWRHPEPEAAR